MQELNTEEEKLSNSAIVFFLRQTFMRGGVDRIIFHRACLFMVPKIGGIDRLVLLILAGSDNFAQIEEAHISIDQYAIMRKLTIISIVQPCCQLRPAHVAQQQTIIPVQKLSLRAFLQQHLVGLGQFVVIFVL